MAKVIESDIDFGEYMRESEPKVKVRRASVFADELVAEFAPRDYRRERVSMRSTKLGGVLEFRPGEITVWAGYNGHRKSMLTGQVALDLCEAGHRVLMISLEMQPKKTLARMGRQASAVAAPSERWLREFGAWTDDRLWLFDHLGRLTPALCVAVLRYFADELKGAQVFIDSMMMVCASEERLDEQKQLITDLVRVAQETNLHVHIVTHCRKPQSGEDRPPTKYDLRGSAAISDQADNVVTVWKNGAKKADKQKRTATDESLDAGDKPDAVVSVEKQRNGEFEGALKLWFDESTFRFMNDRTSPVEPYALQLGAAA